MSLTDGRSKDVSPRGESVLRFLLGFDRLKTVRGPIEALSAKQKPAHLKNKNPTAD